MRAFDVEQPGLVIGDVHQFCETYFSIAGEDTPLAVYSAGYFWGNQTKRGVLGNPPAPDNTELWWARWTKKDDPYTIAELQAKISPAGSSQDPWHAEKIGTWVLPTFRQASRKLIGLDVFDGSHRTTKGERGRPIRACDVSVSFKPYEHLLALAGLNQGELPAPINYEPERQ